ncbi:hypothetical protein RYX36_008292 [Vicia faba]
MKYTAVLVKEFLKAYTFTKPNDLQLLRCATTMSCCYIKVSQDVPKYMMVAGDRAELRGLNLVGLARRGFSIEEIRSLKTAYRKIFMCTDTTAVSFEEKLAQVEQHEGLIHIPAVRALLQSIRDSFAEDRRGICKYRSWNGS